MESIPKPIKINPMLWSQDELNRNNRVTGGVSRNAPINTGLRPTRSLIGPTTMIPATPASSYSVRDAPASKSEVPFRSGKWGGM